MMMKVTNIYNRIPPIYEKLSDQFVYWAKFRYTPKGQLGKIHSPVQTLGRSRSAK